MTEYLIALSCPDRTGLIYAVTRWLLKCGCNVLDSDTYKDLTRERFFMRVHFRGEATLDELERSLVPEAEKLQMRWDLARADTRPRALIMVSKHLHCLLDLLNRVRLGQLALDVPLIVSNHPDAEWLAKAANIEYLHLPVTSDNKHEQEQRVLRAIEKHRIDFVVLARYMQIISPALCEQLPGRIINIHHSFLPGFKGARPYHQAYERGVKLIGATAHYVTAQLDDGPIIAQDVQPVTHRMGPDEMAQVGNDIERVVLARAVQYHAQKRVLINGRRTVVFR
ncbi:formyltetrahydrofolate deformylase [Candidatus Foliamicus sp.]